MKILLLEDEYSYRLSIKEYLLSLDFTVVDFESGDDALDAIFNTEFDLLLMDIRVPGTDGYEITKTVRAEGLDIPIILITSLTDIDNLSIGYEMGCNDYIRKPFELKELKYRVLQTMNQVHFNTTKETIELDDIYKMDLTNYTLYKKNKKIILTKIERKVIFLLMKNVNHYISMETLMDIVWENCEITKADVRMCIKRIRDKTDRDFIKNSRGLGYIIEKR